MTVIDSANIRVLYALNASDINNPETYDDLQRLEIGSHISKYYSFFVYSSDSIVTDWVKKNPNPQGIPIRMGPKGKIIGWTQYVYSDYIKDFSSNQITEYSYMPWGIKTDYQYTESLTLQQWEIHDDTISIVGNLCQKATCNFRGRNYIAWFAIDIPISNGPWKFSGLPGLIMKVYDIDKLYIFECIGIENYKEKFPIKIYPGDYYVKIKRTDLLKLQERCHNDYLKAARITGIDGSSFDNISEKYTIKHAYKTIELK